MSQDLGLMVREERGDCLIPVRVTPRASRTEMIGVTEGRLRVRLQAPPVDGAANKSLTVYLADVLGVPPSAVTVERGLSGREKWVRVAHATVTAVRLTEKIGGRLDRS